MHSFFQPVKSGNKSEAIALQIEAAIMGGNFQSGDRLPSERELQHLFQTSRGVVREALRSLRQKGLLEAKKGAKGGYYIKEVDINEAIDQLAMMIKQQRVPLVKLLEFQYAMDQSVLFAAIANASDSEITRLEDLADQLLKLCNASRPDFEKIANVDKKLNLLMVEMTKNPFFEWVMRTVQLSFRDYEFIVYKDSEVRKTVGQNWHDTAKAIRAKDAQKALRLYGYWYELLELCLNQQAYAGRKII